jgi:AcrR family transcriptional regulator
MSTQKRKQAARQEPVVEDEVAGAIAAAATKNRLLDAAGAIFAEVGYERARIRDITARAHANVSAIKYHFGGKFQLYEAAIAYWVEKQGSPPPVGASAAQGDAEEQLRAFVAKFVGKLLDSGKPAWHSRMMAREMADPTAVLDAMVASTFMPTAGRLRKIVTELAGPGCSKMVVERAMLSVFAQCLIYVNSRPILDRVFPDHTGTYDVAAISEHIATFSIAGMKAIGSGAIDSSATGSRAIGKEPRPPGKGRTD